MDEEFKNVDNDAEEEPVYGNEDKPIFKKSFVI